MKRTEVGVNAMVKNGKAGGKDEVTRDDKKSWGELVIYWVLKSCRKAFEIAVVTEAGNIEVLIC